MSASIASVLSEATPEQVVRAALTILEAHFDNQPDRLARITEVSNTSRKLERAWETLVQESVSYEAAFGTFVQAIAVELEENNAGRP